MKRDLALKGYTLNSVELYGAVILRFTNGPYAPGGPPPSEARLHIGEDFVFEWPAGSCRVEPQTWKNVERIRAILGQNVTSAIATEEGELAVTFSGGYRVSVRNETRYEPWDFSKDDGTLVVAVPGGELAIWSPAPTRSRRVNRKRDKRGRPGF